MQAWQISLIVAALLAIAEVLTLSFILLGFAVGMALVALLQFLGDGYSAVRDISIFAVGSLVAPVWPGEAAHSNDGVKGVPWQTRRCG